MSEKLEHTITIVAPCSCPYRIYVLSISFVTRITIQDSFHGEFKNLVRWFLSYFCHSKDNLIQNKPPRSFRQLIPRPLNLFWLTNKSHINMGAKDSFITPKQSLLYFWSNCNFWSFKGFCIWNSLYFKIFLK